MNEEKEAFDGFLASLFRILAMIAVLASGTVYQFTDYKNIAFHLLCISVLLVIQDNNVRHTMEIDKNSTTNT